MKKETEFHWKWCPFCGWESRYSYHETDIDYTECPECEGDLVSESDWSVDYDY